MPARFDMVVTNAPFQDRAARGRTPHKVWIEFTQATFDRFLKPGGRLVQVSPASFASPSSKVLQLMRDRNVPAVNFDVAHHFPGVGSTFAYYAIDAGPHRDPTEVTCGGETFQFVLDDRVRWLPTDLCDASLSIHRKVAWADSPRLDVRHDYVTCHNTRLDGTLSKTRTDVHVHPVFHTNRQTWWSSVRQDWADGPKVLWTRSGYTKPFADHGVLGGTDMAYYVPTSSPDAADRLAHNLNLAVVRYVLRTARWSGFGNEIVFSHLPALPDDRLLTDADLYDRFELTAEEVDHVERTVG